MKTLITIILTILFTTGLTYGQVEEQDTTDLEIAKKAYLNLNDFKIGDSISIKKPASNNYLFIHQKENKKEKVKKGSKLLGKVGRGIGAVGIGSKSIEVLKTGTKISNTVGILDSAIEISEIFPKDLNDLQVTLSDVQIAELNGLETLVGEFAVDKKVYVVQLTNALYSNEISIK